MILLFLELMILHRFLEFAKISIFFKLYNFLLRLSVSFVKIFSKIFFKV